MELMRYRENGLIDPKYLVAFEKLRFKRELRKRSKGKKVAARFGRLLPRPVDYSIQVSTVAI